MQALTDAYILSKWRTCKSSLQAECNLVDSVHKDKSAFAQPAESAAPPANRFHQVCLFAPVIAALRPCYANQMQD